MCTQLKTEIRDAICNESGKIVQIRAPIEYTYLDGDSPDPISVKAQHPFWCSGIEERPQRQSECCGDCILLLKPKK
jgi:hypothetical protein